MSKLKGSDLFVVTFHMWRYRQRISDPGLSAPDSLMLLALNQHEASKAKESLIRLFKRRTKPDSSAGESRYQPQPNTPMTTRWASTPHRWLPAATFPQMYFAMKNYRKRIDTNNIIGPFLWQRPSIVMTTHTRGHAQLGLWLETSLYEHSIRSYCHRISNLNFQHRLITGDFVGIHKLYTPQTQSTRCLHDSPTSAPRTRTP